MKLQDLPSHMDGGEQYIDYFSEHAITNDASGQSQHVGQHQS
jgi:hypothetical protein